MLAPYTMEKLNAERLKDLDREAAGLRFSSLARHNRQSALHAAKRRLAGLLVSAVQHLRHSAAHDSRRLKGLVPED